MSDRFEFGVTPFYFLRHGETRESQAGILQGQTETILNDTGCKTAEQVAARLVGVHIRSIYASPLKRAWQTATIISAEIRAPAHRESGLMERDWGDFVGRPKSERPNLPDPPTAEAMGAFSARILDTMRRISGPLPLLIVAHSGVFRILAGYAGLAIDHSTTLESGHLILFEPPCDSRSDWQVSEVRG